MGWMKLQLANQSPCGFFWQSTHFWRPRAANTPRTIHTRSILTCGNQNDAKCRVRVFGTNGRVNQQERGACYSRTAVLIPKTCFLDMLQSWRMRTIANGTTSICAGLSKGSADRWTSVGCKAVQDRDLGLETQHAACALLLDASQSGSNRS